MVQQNPPLMLMVPVADTFRLSDLKLPDEVATRVTLNHSKYADLDVIEAIVGGMSFNLTHHAAQDVFQHFSAKKLNHIFCSAPASPIPAIGIALSDHIANAKHDSTVNRTFLELAWIIGEALNATSVIWQPAKLHIGFEYFSEASHQYITGGPFPVLIQIAISENPKGTFHTYGLSYFSGQEMRLSAPAGYPPNQVVKRLVRIAHDIATNGKIDSQTEAQGFVPEEMLTLTPSKDLSVVDITIIAGKPGQLH